MATVNPAWLDAHREYAAARAIYLNLAPPAELPAGSHTAEFDPRTGPAIEACWQALKKIDSTPRYLD